MTVFNNKQFPFISFISRFCFWLIVLIFIFAPRISFAELVTGNDAVTIYPAGSACTTTAGSCTPVSSFTLGSPTLSGTATLTAPSAGGAYELHYNVNATNNVFNLTGISGGDSITSEFWVDFKPTITTDCNGVGNAAEVQLTNIPSTNNGVSRFDVYRDGIYLTTSFGSAGYTDTSVSNSTGYSYYLIAYPNNNGTSSYQTSPVSVTTQNCTPVSLGGLQIIADPYSSSQAKGSYGASGMRNDVANGQTGSNYYNALLVTQTVNNATSSDYYLTGTAFIENPKNPQNLTNLEQQSSTNSNPPTPTGFILVYANKTPPGPVGGQTFTAGNFYVYFNGKWSSASSTQPYIDNSGIPANDCVLSPTPAPIAPPANCDTKLEVNIPQSTTAIPPGTNNPPSYPDFSVYLYHALGNHQWAQYGYLDDANGKETVTPEPACDADIPAHCVSALP